jgi:CubicO group peptidase (beta-lactamase class C family)
VGPLEFEPGERWLYSTSTDWLGRVVEKVSGQPLEDYFRQRIFTPLGMPDTFYHVPKDKEARLVTVNRRQADGTMAKDSVQPPTSGFTPIGGGRRPPAITSVHARVAQRRRARGRAHPVGQLSRPDGPERHRRARGSALRPRYGAATTSFVTDGRDKWSLGFLITADAVPGKRSAGSLSWGRINNTYYWLDPTAASPA